MTGIQEDQFFAAFNWAVIRLATYFPATASQARLLFGSVTLLTNDRPRPSGDKNVDSHKVGRGRSGKIFFRRTVLSTRNAVEWYRKAGPDGIETPRPDDPGETDGKKDGVALAPDDFEDDPPWPSLGVPLGTDLFSNAGNPGDPAPFRGPGAPRIHRRFGDNTGFDAVINDAFAIRFLKRRVHLDVADYTEYLGGLALVVPDPVLRRVQHYLVPPSSPDQPERLVYRLVPRSRQKIDGLQLTVLERRSNLLSQFKTSGVPSDGLVFIESRLPFHQTGYAVSHPVQGVIAYQQPISFIRAVNVNFGVAGRRIKVQVPQTEAKRSLPGDYEIAEYAHDIPISAGEVRRDAAVKVIEAEQRRIRRAAAKKYKQTWFDDGQRQAATAFLRRQLGTARTSVIVADPYFGALQFYQFLQAVPRTQVDFTVLTSRLAFELHYAEGIDPQDDAKPDRGEAAGGILTEHEKLDGFARSLEALKKRGMQSVTALVFEGRPPPLHDRFLVIDDQVLFLGNSLNALGERASLILLVPDGEVILAKLHGMARQAMPFNSYAEQRRKISPRTSERD